MDVRDPDAGQAAHHLPDPCQAKTARELAQAALPAIQQHAASLEAVDIDAGDIAVLGWQGRPCAQKHHLHLPPPCLHALTHLVACMPLQRHKLAAARKTCMPLQRHTPALRTQGTATAPLFHICMQQSVTVRNILFCNDGHKLSELSLQSCRCKHKTHCH